MPSPFAGLTNAGRQDFVSPGQSLRRKSTYGASSQSRIRTNCYLMRVADPLETVLRTGTREKSLDYWSQILGTGLVMARMQIYICTRAAYIGPNRAEL